MSARCRGIHRKNPLRAAERMPLRFSVIIFTVSTREIVYSMASDYRLEFIRFTIERNALRFGEFKTKAGRLSPYFFDAGLFCDGESLKRLSQFYAKAILASGIAFDMLFGPAYKGIPLVAAVAIALADSGRAVRYSFNRKEAKDHGEGGNVIGATLSGRVLIVDDVISAGTSVRESVNLIRASSAIPCGVAIALDRMERGSGGLSAVQEVQRSYNIPVVSIARLDDLVGYLEGDSGAPSSLEAIRKYREQYGVEAHD
jgi:orotate phosphoribosyltransferase